MIRTIRKLTLKRSVWSDLLATSIDWKNVIPVRNENRIQLRLTPRYM